jgi:hypothetical protein
MEWILFKAQLSELTVSKDALHIYAAFLIQVFRVSFSSVMPWIAVLVAATANEVLDLVLEDEATIQQWQIDGSIHDMINTMLLPTLLLLLARYFPSIICAAAPPSSTGEEAAEPD